MIVDNLRSEVLESCGLQTTATLAIVGGVVGQEIVKVRHIPSAPYALGYNPQGRAYPKLIFVRRRCQQGHGRMSHVI
jgi:hypothetical protein